MKFLLTVCVFLLTVSSSLSVDITVTGTEGRRVNIKCPYDKGLKEYHKYFFKGLPKKQVLILQSDGRKTSGRFSLKDNHQTRSFTVTISDLRMEDAGPYACRAGSANYNQIHLNVIRAPETTRPVQISTSTIHPFTNTSSDHTSTDLSSVAGILGLVLLVLTLCSGTFLILKKRKRKSGTALFEQNVQLNTETDCMYEEIPNTDVTAETSSSNQTPASSSNQSPASSSNQTPASHLNTRLKVSIFYATVTNQQPDSNPGHTHLTNQVTDTDCDYYANIKSPKATQDSWTELIYTTATHPQNITTDVDPIYSVINHK